MNEKPLSRRKVVASIGALSVTGLIGACSTADEQIAVEQPATETTPETSPEASATSESETSVSTGLISVSEVPVGGAVILSEEKVVVTQPTPGEINAFSTTCTHQGCPVSQVSESGIICACHNSVFSTLDGSVISGPAGRALDPIEITIQGDQVIRS
ncbi:MAG: hypothetical protein RL677_323 [Actinomycetota bacterium]|jgi:Rieske Fe-S protein